MEVVLQTSLDLRRCTRFIRLLAGFSVDVLNATGAAGYYALSAIVFGAQFGATWEEFLGPRWSGSCGNRFPTISKIWQRLTDTF